jgi:hypothetical protein
MLGDDVLSQDGATRAKCCLELCSAQEFTKSSRLNESFDAVQNIAERNPSEATRTRTNTSDELCFLQQS